MPESLLDRAGLNKALALREAASFHKRQSHYHRKLAREKMTELAQFCAQNGIKFEVISGRGIDTNGKNERHQSNQ